MSVTFVGTSELQEYDEVAAAAHAGAEARFELLSQVCGRVRAGVGVGPGGGRRCYKGSAHACAPLAACTPPPTPRCTQDAHFAPLAARTAATHPYERIGLASLRWMELNHERCDVLHGVRSGEARTHCCSAAPSRVRHPARPLPRPPSPQSTRYDLAVHEWGGAYTDILTAHAFGVFHPGLTIVVQQHGGNFWSTQDVVSVCAVEGGWRS